MGEVEAGIPGMLVELHSTGLTRDERLRETIARFTGGDASGVIVTRRCQRCGSVDHGAPASAGVSISRARSGGYELTAVVRGARPGVDLEQIAQVATGDADAVLLHPSERPWLVESVDPDRDRAALWVAKEAVLKALGLGLVVEPRELALAWDAGDLVVRDAPAWLGIAGARIRIFDAGPGLVGAATVLALAGA